MAEENKPKPEQKSTVDKIIMGAIIGTAIGTAVSFSLAPQKGKETREELKTLSKDTAGGIFRLGKAILRRLFKGKKKMHAHPMKELPNEMEIFPPKHKD